MHKGKQGLSKPRSKGTPDPVYQNSKLGGRYQIIKKYINRTCSGQEKPEHRV